jgi:hypothetical protein
MSAMMAAAADGCGKGMPGGPQMFEAPTAEKAVVVAGVSERFAKYCSEAV